MLKNLKRSTLCPISKEQVQIGSTIYTDRFLSYKILKNQGYNHEIVNHVDGQYVNGNAHTNTFEGFWSLLKRGINGVYHSVSEKHLQKYVDKYLFRYNHRKDETPMFITVLNNI
jgi:transposase